MVFILMWAGWWWVRRKQDSWHGVGLCCGRDGGGDDVKDRLLHVCVSVCLCVRIQVGPLAAGRPSPHVRTYIYCTTLVVMFKQHAKKKALAGYKGEPTAKKPAAARSTGGWCVPGWLDAPSLVLLRACLPD